MKIYADKNWPRANGEGCHSDVSRDLEPPIGSGAARKSRTRNLEIPGSVLRTAPE